MEETESVAFKFNPVVILALLLAGFLIWRLPELVKVFK